MLFRRIALNNPSQVENRAEDEEVGMGPFGKTWTREEDQLLRQEILADTPLDVIADKLGRTKPAIRTRAYILRLKLGRPRKRDFT